MSKSAPKKSTSKRGAAKKSVVKRTATKASAPRASASKAAESASARIDARIAELDDWRGQRLAQIRAQIKAVLPDVLEEWKWRGTPTWSHGGILCTGETYKDKVKVTFFKGAALADEAGLFNASLEGNARRAMDLHEHDKLNKSAFKALIRAAAELNAAD
jgi:hypothetical protein